MTRNKYRMILQEAVQHSRGCDLYQNATQTVFGELETGAKAKKPKVAIMMIGEQPGDQEDKQARPFVGPAGKYWIRVSKRRIYRPPKGLCRRQGSEWLRDDSEILPLQKMDVEERLVADYAGTGLTTGKRPMHFRRLGLRQQSVRSVEELKHCRNGEFVRTAGCVIVRRRPGTAKGFIFISMED